MNAPLVFESSPVRMDVIDGQPWFALIDVANALDISSYRQFAQSARCSKAGVRRAYASDGKQNRKIVFINERNLYAMIARSDKPEALRFMDWVYGEVLPAIRQTGAYPPEEAVQSRLGRAVCNPWSTLSIKLTPALT